MKRHTGAPSKAQGWVRPMRSRSQHEEHRASTPLELLFDLVFVIAVAQAASALHHGITAGHVAEATLGFAMLFFAIWWAWMNFTWFASAYDTDDVPYRLAVFVQLSGAQPLRNPGQAQHQIAGRDDSILAHEGLRHARRND